MTRAATLFALVLSMGVLAGCNGSSTASTAEENAPAAPAANDAAAAPAQAAPPRKAVEVAVDASPEQVVSTFLAALKAGDEATTAALLTAKAREETAKHQLDVAPQSAPGATYEVSAGKILADNPHGAHVSSVWTETYPDGSLTYEIVWVLRQQQDGWRIAGLAMELIPGQPPQFLNFEDPADMLRKREEALAAYEQQAQQEAAQQAAAAAAGQFPAGETAQAPQEDPNAQQNLQR